MIINESSLGAIHTQFDMSFNRGRMLARPYWQEIATETKSTSATTQYNFLGAFPKIRQWVGGRIHNKLKGHGYSITNQKYEVTVDVEVEDLEDDQIGLYGTVFEDYGRAVEVFPDELLAALIAAGITGGTGLCYDGQNMFDTDHPVGSSTASNYNTGAGDMWILLDLSRSLKPFIVQKRKPFNMVQLNSPNDQNVFEDDVVTYGSRGRLNVGYGLWQQCFASKETLSATTYNANFAAMMAFTDDEGRKLGIKPTHLLHGPSNRALALEVLQAERLANGATNVNRGTAIPLLVPWL